MSNKCHIALFILCLILFQYFILPILAFYIIIIINFYFNLYFFTQLGGLQFISLKFLDLSCHTLHLSYLILRCLYINYTKLYIYMRLYSFSSDITLRANSSEPDSMSVFPETQVLKPSLFI